ncbi:LysR family transcriptional regulator [Pseudomonas agarici]|uniref:LysR family transcriptional regulator n=1 Tax=Pseudomonas agarici TaxID=46677 RepID=A0A0X1T7V1_PSEAA|nr:LysR substrate-binding domain-containing protein [Pseudomonas agarici]AMB88155.1 LysR family transcriptional regulator [Pseudomonas agarici]NWB93580.1 LysR family transcriptional regulator [Pseudomonas agarici]
MNLKQLNYFVKIIEAQNMTRAAEGLHIAQPALSQQITLLEDELGVKLLNRSSRGIQATQQGDLLYRHAKTILRQVDNTRVLISKKEGDMTGNVSIGMPSSTSKLLALRLMRLVKERYPSIMLEIVDAPSADLVSLVGHGRVDFSLVPDPQKPKDMDFLPLFREELYLMTRHDVIPTTGPVSLKRIAEMPLILPSMPNTLRSRVEHAFLRANLAFDLFGEASTSAILIPAVRAGLAATILPYSAGHEEILNRQVDIHGIEGGFGRDVYLCISNTLPISPVTTTVIDQCHAALHELLENGFWKGCELL